MHSHTVPEKLLRQFAYYHVPTKSFRLWRYERNRSPYGKVSPRIATVIDGHFRDPHDATKEEDLERRLNQEFEQPVHDYIHQLGFRTFVISHLHKRQLASYLWLLFHRSRARRYATEPQIELAIKAWRALRANPGKLAELAAKWTVDGIRNGDFLNGRAIRSWDVAAVIDQTIQKQLTKDYSQHSYIQSMENAMSLSHDAISAGEWRIVHTSPDSPFVIGDAPVVTWERIENQPLIWGQGFNKADVEIFVPVSPIACLHILPSVLRIRHVLTPSVLEINQAQAAFAFKSCYTNVGDSVLESSIKNCFGLAKIGTTAFSIRHNNYNQVLFELLKERYPS